MCPSYDDDDSSVNFDGQEFLLSIGISLRLSMLLIHSFNYSYSYYDRVSELIRTFEMRPVGLTFFRSEYDSSVDEIYHNYLGREAPIFGKKKDQSTRSSSRNYIA
jgi:hypothetical protein